jgi:hypothetical protein
MIDMVRYREIYNEISFANKIALVAWLVGFVGIVFIFLVSFLST